MTKKQISILFSIFLILIFSNLSSAWIVTETHDWVGDKALSQSPNSWGGQIVSENWDDFSACMSLTDYSVFFYFQQGFSTIGKVYLGSHNNNICKRAVELADKSNPAQMACAIGICSMQFMDEPSHYDFVPTVVERTGLVNGIIHAPAEECVNKKISTSELKSKGKGALVNKYPIHKEYLIKVFQSDNRASSIDVGLMMDAFVAEVANSNQYTVGFRGFTAIPLSIHVVLLLWFLFGIFSLIYLIRKKDKTKFNKFSMVLLILFFILPTILLYTLYFTGNLWRGFQFATNFICPVMPISGYEDSLNKAVANEVNLFNNGADAIFQLRDPSGQQALANADAGNMWKLWAMGIFLLLLIVLFIWLNFRRKK